MRVVVMIVAAIFKSTTLVAERKPIAAVGDMQCVVYFLYE